jgi:hypothetical protein
MARTTHEVLASGKHIRWAVLWAVPDGHTYSIVRKDFEHDLDGAMDLYMRAKAAGKRLATLMSPNCAFAPPKKYLPYTRRAVELREVKVLRKGRQVTRKKKVLVTKDIIPMEGLNRKGIFWCPYCREMRKFQMQSGMTTTEGNWMEAPGLYCPMCGVSHRLMPVRQYNPHANRLYVSQTTSNPRRQKSNSRSKTRSGTRQSRSRTT